MSRLAFSALAGALMMAGSAHAYTPEGGFWWNPQESGSGLQLEIQDNFIAIVGYSYDADGNQMWVTATGFLDDNASFSSSDNPNDGSWLNTFTGGQCLGCDYSGYPTAHAGSEGEISLVFNPDDPTKATLTWGGRTQQIERYQFYLKRGEDGSAPLQVTKMLGEWHTVQDFSDMPNYNGYPYFGEVLGFESLTQANNGTWLFEGCRTDDSLGAGCTEVEDGLYYHDAAGLFDTDFGRQLIVVTDSRDNDDNAVNCVLYDVQTGTDFFSGGLDYEHDGASGGIFIYPCGDDPFDFDSYPVRGYRSASRTFIQDGYGPSKRTDNATFSPRTLSAQLTPVKRPASKARPAYADKLQDEIALLEKHINTPRPVK